MEAKLAWKRSGKTIVGTVDLDIPDLSHLALPVVATFAKKPVDRGDPPRLRVWRGDVENGTWVRLQGPWAQSNNLSVSRHERVQDIPLATQLDALLGVERSYECHVSDYRIMDRVRLPGIDLQYERKKSGAPLREVAGEEAILSLGGSEALEFARWSASLYAIMDGGLWRRHPGPLFQTRGRDDGTQEASWIETLTSGGYTLDANSATRWDEQVWGPRDGDYDIQINSPEALEAFDDDALTMEKMVRFIRHAAGLRRVGDLAPIELRTIAKLARIDEGHPVAASRRGDPNDWPYDERRFDFPFRPELVESMKGVYELFRKDFHVSYRARVEAILNRLEERAARALGMADLSDEDREALESLPAI